MKILPIGPYVTLKALRHYAELFPHHPFIDNRPRLIYEIRILFAKAKLLKNPSSTGCLIYKAKNPAGVYLFVKGNAIVAMFPRNRVFHRDGVYTEEETWVVQEYFNSFWVNEENKEVLCEAI